MPDLTTTWTCDGCNATGTTDREADKHAAPGHSTVTHNRPAVGK